MKKLVIIKSCSFLIPSTAIRDVTQVDGSFSSAVMFSWTGLKMQSEETVCNSLLALVPNFLSRWYHQVGNRESSCATGFAVFALAHWRPHSLPERVLLCPFLLLTHFYHSLCGQSLTAVITGLTLYMALEARWLWEDHWLWVLWGAMMLWT